MPRSSHALQDARERVLAQCESCELELGQSLVGPGLRATHAWFPLDAIVSLGIPAADKPHCFGVALVGGKASSAFHCCSGPPPLRCTRWSCAYHRGVLTVLDRRGLEDAACDCYAADCIAYASGMRRAG